MVKDLEYLTHNQLKSLYWKYNKPGYREKKKEIIKAIVEELSKRAYGKKIKKKVA